MLSKSESVANALIGVGFVSLIVGLLSAFSRALNEALKDFEFGVRPLLYATRSPEWLQAIERIIKTIAQSIIDLLIAFRESPVWLVLIFVGIFLIVMGLYIKPEKIAES